MLFNQAIFHFGPSETIATAFLRYHAPDASVHCLCGDGAPLPPISFAEGMLTR
jgi:hypothetical protein